MPIDKETVLKNVSRRKDVRRKLGISYYEKTQSGEKGFLLSAELDYDSNEFVTDAINFLTQKEYINEEYRLAWVKDGLFAEAGAPVISEILKRLLVALDRETSADLIDIKTGMLLFDTWDDKMGYFETKKKKYLYAWMTTA